ncbi:MAG: hypothetical protein NXI17_19880 [Alphaproteobacteria bacterium]|nr:hypothetical protein [Alphaproteobacteria bacterium]
MQYTASATRGHGGIQANMQSQAYAAFSAFLRRDALKPVADRD